MPFLILDNYFTSINQLEIFTSSIWCDRFNTYGDVEISTVVSYEALELLRPGHYIWSSESEHMMLIESSEIKTYVEQGNTLIIKGRSLESLLERRIVWNQTLITGNLQDSIERLLNENAISPAIPERIMHQLAFDRSYDSAITELTMTAQFTGDTLYDAIAYICASNDIGFKVTLSSDNKLMFKLYPGVDHSYEQSTTPYIVFSPSYDNLISSNYFESNALSRSVGLVGGEGVGSERTMVVCEGSDGPLSDLDRREVFINASDLSRTTSDGTLTEEEYIDMLRTRGNDTLATNTVISSFDGQADVNGLFVIGRDFYMGDILQIVNMFGLESRSRVTEVIMSENSSGKITYPTFTKVL